MRKKICFFSGDITRSGGTERVAVQLANALQEDHTYDICVISLTEQQEFPFYPLHPEINRYRLGKKWINPGPGYLPLIGKLRKFLKEQLAEIAPEADIHDLRIVPGPTHTNVIFDCAVPADWLAAKDHRANKVPAALRKAVSDRWPDHFCVIQLEPIYAKLK